MVFQNYALYQHFTVEKNIGLSLLTHDAKSAAAETAVQNALAVLAGNTPPNLVNTPFKTGADQ